MKLFVVLQALVGLGPACRGGSEAKGDDADEVPERSWHFDAIDVVATSEWDDDWTLTDVWGYTDAEHPEGVVFATGWHGTILRYDETLSPEFHRMPAGTRAHLTAIAGVRNGRLFGLPAEQGEIVAVGWSGTILHYHPNPDGDPLTADGAWSAISSIETPTLAPRLKPDPACPDRDGDGVADDGDGSGWWGDAVCADGMSTECDDNCRRSANGDQRPVRDTTGDGCIGPGDGPHAESSWWQRDGDGDGVGDVCDGDPAQAPPARFDSPLFDVWARADGDRLTVVAVGGDGALVTFVGLSAARQPTAEDPVVTDPKAWVAQRSLPFRYADEVGCAARAAPGEVCPDTGRLPPSCEAQCHPRATTCSCPFDQGQCCDASAPTGAACADGSCPSAANACDAASGTCSALCPGCFRYLEHTLRGIAASATDLVAVGARGMIVTAPVADPTGVWTAPVCLAPPPLLQEQPLLGGIGVAGDPFYLVGAGGAVLRYSVAATGCPLESVEDAPAGFLSAVFMRGNHHGYAVGDGGLLATVRRGGVSVDASMAHGSTASFTSIWAFRRDDGSDGLWMVGASGTIVRGLFY